MSGRLNYLNAKESGLTLTVLEGKFFTPINAAPRLQRATTPPPFLPRPSPTLRHARRKKKEKKFANISDPRGCAHNVAAIFRKISQTSFEKFRHHFARNFATISQNISPPFSKNFANIFRKFSTPFPDPSSATRPGEQGLLPESKSWKETFFVHE